MSDEGSLLGAVGWMLLLLLLLGWIPILGALIAGFVGGRKAYTVGKAILASLITAFIIAIPGILLISLLTGLFGIETFLTIGLGLSLVLVLASSILTMIGAIIGALTAD